MSGGIVCYRFENAQVDVFQDGDMYVYIPETGKILAEGKVTKVYETT